MQLFDLMRQHNHGFYTQNPILSATPAQLVHWATQAGTSVEELLQTARTPHIEMTCPLCGQPQTHLTLCKGCCGGAFGFEIEEAHGPDVINRLRNAAQALFSTIPGITPEQLEHATRHAYNFGGCMICADCWRYTSHNFNAYSSCPLNLLHERTLHQSYSALIPMAINGIDPTAWAERVRHYWTSDLTPEQSDWRNALLDATLANLGDQSASIRQQIEQIIASETH